jgi:membrane-associated protease RseP (regulator of RpoE activity)
VKDPLDDSPPVETRKAITGIAVIVIGLAVLVAARPSAWVTISIIVGLVLTIMLHEAGHMVMAKRSGMKVTEFFVGFGPRLWSFRKGETEYGVKAIPAGGYVRIIGMSNVEETDPADEPRLYRTATTANKLKTILAGVTVNLIIAFVLFFIVIVGNGEFKASTTVDQVQKESPAATAGLRTGDKIVAINGVAIKSWDALGENVRPNADKELTVTAVRNGERVTIHATPEDVAGEGKLGVTSKSVRQTYSPVEAVPQSFSWMWRATTATVGGLAKYVTPGGVSQYSKTVTDPDGKGALSNEERPRSVVGIVADGGDIVGGSVWVLLVLLATINLFLALFNLIPLLPFDGGHAVVAIYESVASKLQGRKVQVDYRKLMPLSAAVLIVILALGLSTMYLDIRHIVTG